MLFQHTKFIDESIKDPFIKEYMQLIGHSEFGPCYKELKSINLKYENPLMHDSLLNKLDNWEKKLIKPNWIENKNWNIVTEMIYQDLMNNEEIRAYSPKDLN